MRRFIIIGYSRIFIAGQYLKSKIAELKNSQRVYAEKYVSTKLNVQFLNVFSKNLKKETHSWLLNWIVSSAIP